MTGTKLGITSEHAERLREDFKRAAHVQRLVQLHEERKPIQDAELKVLVLLMREEYDAIARDFGGMLAFTNGHKEVRD